MGFIKIQLLSSKDTINTYLTKGSYSESMENSYKLVFEKKLNNPDKNRQKNRYFITWLINNNDIKVLMCKNAIQ